MHVQLNIVWPHHGLCDVRNSPPITSFIESATCMHANKWNWMQKVKSKLLNLLDIYPSIYVNRFLIMRASGWKINWFGLKKLLITQPLTGLFTILYINHTKMGWVNYLEMLVSMCNWAFPDFIIMSVGLKANFNAPLSGSERLINTTWQVPGYMSTSHFQVSYFTSHWHQC